MHRRVDREYIELMDFTELAHQASWRCHVADFPAGDMVGFAKARNDECAFGQAWVTGGAAVPVAIKHHVFIDFVADQVHIAWGQQGLQSQHVGVAPHGATGVVWAVDQQRPGAGTQGCCDTGKIRPEGAGRQRNPHHGAAREFYARHIGVVAGLQNNDFIARMHQGQERGQDGLGRTGRDGDLADRVVVASVQGGNFARNGFTQGGDAAHGRVLVVSRLHRAVNRVDQFRVTREIGKSLSQIHGLVFGGQGRHHGEYRGAYLGQTAFQGLRYRRHAHILPWHAPPQRASAGG